MLLMIKFKKGNNEVQGVIENKEEKKESKKSAYRKAIRQAIENEDWTLYDMLKAISKEHEDELFKEQLKFMGIGAGLTYVGLAIGFVGTAVYKHAKK